MKDPSTSTKIKIIAFGILAEKLNANKITVDGIENTASLRIWLQTNYPELKEIQMSIAVNKKIVHQNISLHTGDEIALLPPFSGG